jgi:hypothetical protein
MLPTLDTLEDCVKRRSQFPAVGSRFKPSLNSPESDEYVVRCIEYSWFGRIKRIHAVRDGDSNIYLLPWKEHRNDTLIFNR